MHANMERKIPQCLFGFFVCSQFLAVDDATALREASHLLSKHVKSQTAARPQARIIFYNPYMRVYFCI